MNDYNWTTQPCWLAPFDQKHRPCEGRIDRAHLIAQQILKRTGHTDLLSDPRTFVSACRRHHGLWDSWGAVVVPREAVPEALEALCEEVGLVHTLDRRFGARSKWKAHVWERNDPEYWQRLAKWAADLPDSF